MTTLPEPKLFTCERCQEPIPFWDWEKHEVGATPPPALCPDHLIEAAPSEKQDSTRNRQFKHQSMRRKLGKPPGTLVAWEVALADRGWKSVWYPAYVYAVCVDWWHPSWPQTVFPWQPNIWQPLGVIFAATVTDEWSGPAWELTWSWEQPEVQATCELLLWNIDTTLARGERLIAALGAFREWRTSRGRPRGTTDYTREDLDRMLKDQSGREGAVPKLKDFLYENVIGDSTFKKYRKRYTMGTYHEWTQEVLGSGADQPNY